jgi:hypothetical protein
VQAIQGCGHEVRISRARAQSTQDKFEARNPKLKKIPNDQKDAKVPNNPDPDLSFLKFDVAKSFEF